MNHAHGSHADPDGGSGSREEILQRWRNLRAMLTRQLDMFESGDLTLRADGADISPAAIADLKHSILEFDALISGDAEARTTE